MSTGPGEQAAAAPAPLEPPQASLTLTAPAAPAAVVATQAPAMAPQVAPELVPELDAKVDGFMAALTSTAARSPEFAAQADDVRTMGDADIRKAAETSNRMLDRPVTALRRRAGWPRAPQVGKTLLELRRTVEDLDPSEATGRAQVDGPAALRRQGRGLLPQYQSCAEPAQRRSCTACATARTS